MTDGSAPLSRKERRALEAQLQAAGDPTQALPVTPETAGVSAATRRDRRRMERLDRPMEVWTAEEEMIATGQIPAMTPELIAEQERLARERAAQADADARAAAQELGIRAPVRESLAPAADEPVSDQVAEHVAEPEQAPQAEYVAEFAPVAEPSASAEPVEATSAQPVDDAPIEPVNDEPAAPDDDALAASDVDAPVDGAPAAAAAEVDQSSGESTADAAPANDDVDAETEVAEAAPAESADVASDGIPEQFRNWFPPGSLQARAAEKPSVDAAPVPSNDAVDEIRRLTQEAMAGITRATTGAVPITQAGVAADADGGTPAPESAPTDQAQAGPAQPTLPVPGPIAPVEPPLALVYPPPGAGESAPAASDMAAAYPEFAEVSANSVPALPAGIDLEQLWSASADVETLTDGAQPLELVEVPFAEELATDVPDGAHTSEVAPPVWNTLVPATLAPQRQFVDAGLADARAHAALTPTPTPTVWDSHPLAQASAAPVRELAPQASTEALPRPDLSGLLPNPPRPVNTGTAEAPTFTGSIPISKQEALPPAAAGARHFRWAHLAVIGAIAFLLGVLAWNIARSGS